MHEVEMQTAEQLSTREATDRTVKILDGDYVKADLDQASSNTTQMNAEERNQLLVILKDFEELFDGTLGDWDTHPVDLELNIDSKPFNCKYYPVPRINKDTFIKELDHLVNSVTTVSI